MSMPRRHLPNPRHSSHAGWTVPVPPVDALHPVQRHHGAAHFLSGKERDGGAAACVQAVCGELRLQEVHTEVHR